MKMNTKQRIILFLSICITVRLCLVLAAKFGSNHVQNLLAVFAVTASLGFMYQFFYHPTKLGGFGGQPWWNRLRPVHAFLYMIFALIIFSGKRKWAWTILLTDVIIGLFAFIMHYR